MDYVLALAVKVLEEEKCPQCGVPTWHAYSTDSSVAFKMHKITCYSCAYKDEEEKAEKDKEPGVTNIVVPIPEDGYEGLPERVDYYVRAQEEAIRDAEREALEHKH
jgi:hypothetical protein